MSCLHPVKNLASLRLVLVFCGEPFIAHRLEFAQAVSIVSAGGSHSRPNVTGITLQAKVGASIGLVLAVSEVGDDGGGPSRVGA